MLEMQEWKYINNWNQVKHIEHLKYTYRFTSTSKMNVYIRCIDEPVSILSPTLSWYLATWFRCTTARVIIPFCMHVVHPLHSTQRNYLYEFFFFACITSGDHYIPSGEIMHRSIPFVFCGFDYLIGCIFASVPMASEWKTYRLPFLMLGLVLIL